MTWIDGTEGGVICGNVNSHSKDIKYIEIYFYFDSHQTHWSLYGIRISNVYNLLSYIYLAVEKMPLYVISSRAYR